MDRGRGRRKSQLIAAVAAGGVVSLTGATLAYPPPLDGPTLRRALVLLVLTAVAEQIAIPVRHGRSGELLTLFELAVVANIVLLPASLAAAVSVAGLALALAVQRRSPVKFAFNIGQYAVGLVPAIAAYHAIGEGQFSSPRGLAALFGGMAVFTAVNLLTISAIIAAETDRPFRGVLVQEQGISVAMGIGTSAVGLVAIQLYLTRPELLPAVLAPALALHLAFRGWVEQKQLSSRMEEETTKLGRILEHSSEGIVLADADGTVVLWSPSMERITGVPAVEAVGKAVAYLVRGRGPAGEQVAAEVSGSAEPFELEVIAADGSARWLRVQHGPGYDADGDLSFDVILVTDITRQREVDRLKEDFFATVSHELRTPLTPIKGYATLLLRGMEDIPADRRREALQSIVERADHMARLVEDMLLASRMAGAGDGQVRDVQRQPVDLGSLCERALRSFRSAHPLRDFRLSTGPGVVAAADPMRVEQIIANLVSNAVKFSDDGTPVDVEVERLPSGTAIRVRDGGRGIPADRFEEIFEKFRRVEDPMRMETGGAGLGLYIVRQLARAMGGEVSVRSDLGKGSTFEVMLPAAGPAVHAVPERAAG